MAGRGSTIFVCALCALLLSAFTAAGADAATNGTTEFTCVKQTGEGPTTFKDAHCKEPAVGTGSYGHLAITGSTELSTTNEFTNSGTTSSLFLVVKWANEKGEVTEFTANGISGTATQKNALNGTGEHFFHFESPAKATSLKFTGVTTPAPFCKVVGLPGGEEAIEWKPMTATSEGQGMQVKFTPLEEVFAEFEFANKGGECKAGKGVQKLVGSFKVNTAGATLEFTHNQMVSEGTFRLGTKSGLKVGMEGRLTVSARAKKEEAYVPIAPTTVETP